MSKTEAAIEEPKEEKPKLEGWGERHTVGVLAFMSIVTAYQMRVNLSVAIVAMVSNATDATNETHEVLSDTCPLPDNYDANAGVAKTGEFEWNEHTQGLALAAFYYGYAITNPFGGRAAEIFGSRMVLFVGLMLTSALALASPIAAEQSVVWFLAIRILQGCAQGCTFPSTNYLIANWYPIHERSKFASNIYIGTQAGTITALAITGWLCSTTFLGGWPSAFYVFGAWGFVFAIIWLIVVRDSPAKSSRISQEELKFIVSGCAAQKDEEKVPLPFKDIFTSRYFWTIAIMHFGYNWGFLTLLQELPTYLDAIQHINIQTIGLISAMPNIGAWIVSVIFSFSTDRLLARGVISILTIRKLAMIVSGYLPMVCLLLMCVVNCHAVWAIALLIVSGSLNGASYCGYMCSHADIAPRFAGTLMGLTNSIGTIPGFVVPSVTGALTHNNQTLWAWRTLFLMGAAIYGVSVTVYLLFITTEVQPWNDPKPKKEIKKEIAVAETTQ